MRYSSFLKTLGLVLILPVLIGGWSGLSACFQDNTPDHRISRSAPQGEGFTNALALQSTNTRPCLKLPPALPSASGSLPEEWRGKSAPSLLPASSQQSPTYLAARTLEPLPSAWRPDRIDLRLRHHRTIVLLN